MVTSLSSPAGHALQVPDPPPGWREDGRIESPAVVRVSALSKGFPPRRGWRQLLRRPGRAPEKVMAVDRLTFEVKRGEIFGLLGPNGAGKTTLLKMLSTLIEPDDGTALIAGADLTKDPAAVRRVLSPVIADERSLNWRLSARENLRFYGALCGLKNERLQSRIATVLMIVGLQDAGTKMVGAFSSGMRQRLLIGRALLAEPAVLLLDEPTRSLDPLAAREFRSFLRRDITGTQGCTIVLATHDPEEGLELCDRVAVLDRGRSVASGSPGELMELVDCGRYRVRTRTADHPRLRNLGATVRTDYPNGNGDADWSSVDMEIPGGDAAALRTLRLLVDDGVEIARFEKVNPTMAELIERLLQIESNRAQ